MPIKFFIDQGHNPSGNVNAGAVGNGLYEGDITYQTGVWLANLLNNDPRFEARLSRPSPTTVLGTSNTTSLDARVQAANLWPANYFISIHCNASENTALNGSEIYIYQYYTQANWLAQRIMMQMTKFAGTKDNGIFAAPTLYVLRKTAMPALLIELGYLTNWNDAQKLYYNSYPFALGIYMGILDYFGFLPQ
ncbi:N-acetylmuramoyl-L-alanine amidase family protein [Anaeromicropila populeti]|uniref:N-acetylmuramoyl-L-alanine amidase n=1 Tax=Anaeromicropila populeti TaxID=37658 RepID=A0A1I6JRW1_9FIRM|nr:N-acetylmuramoyl-L-alanine amidase [Anaeromicropila populeti]SFR81693.1 N-acetylmuramoyl-L-alanine amidase [Anaeromicropila populeti]